jgi:hypothetical protein
MHRAHDYPHLIERWRRIAKTAGLRLQRFAVAGKYPLYCLRSPALRAEGGIYLSAGIHGDEAGSTEGLLAWAERSAARLRDLPLFLFPCLNPWGIVNNTRFDANGVDLNRAFHRDDIPELVALRALVTPYKFELSMMLHEDYDGQGLYLYEVQRKLPYWGEALIEAARPVIPIEERPLVDGFPAKGGVVRRKPRMKRFDVIGFPEAIWLHLGHSVRTFTVEAPSEFALAQRVEGLVAVTNEAVRLAQETTARSA